MRKHIRLLCVICLCLCLITPSHAQSATEKSYLVPKYITAEEKNLPIYDGELAEFLRKASSDAYAVYDGKMPSNLVSAGFTDYVYSYHTDESVFYEVLNSDDELVRVAIPLETHFVTASTQFTVGDRTQNVVVISFQGTVLEELPLLTDIMVFDVGGFHAGFISAAQAAYNYLSTSVSYRNLGMTFRQVLEKANDPESGYHILVTGHSLGGAVANLFTSKFLNEAVDNRLNTLCYTYACPLVCDDWRADLLDGSNIMNIINTLDIVPYVGYQLKEGTRPGHEVSDAVMEELGDFVDSHRINHGYKDLLKIIEQDLEGHYPALYRGRDEGAVIHTSTGGNGKGVFFPKNTLDRFQDHQLIVHSEYMLQDDITYPFSELTVQGGYVDGSAQNVVLPCDLVIESGGFSLGTGTVTVDGDLRLQKHDGDGTFTGGAGHLLMKDTGHLLVTGDVCFQGGDSNFLYNPDMTAGTLEVKGDFSALPSTGDQCEMVFLPKYDHKVLLSGSEPQTIYFAPYVDNSSYIAASFCHFETTNPHPLIAPEALSFQHIEDDLTFTGNLTLDAHGDLIVNADHTIKADNIFLKEATHPEIYTHLTLDGNVQGGRLDIGEYQGAKGIVTVTGDLMGTDIYFSTSLEPSILEIQGNYLSNNGDLCLCDGQMIVRGDFRYQTQLENDLYITANNPFASIYDGARLEIGGDLYLQGESGTSLGFPENLPCILKGDLIQICDEADPNFWNYGLRNLVLAGETKQTIDAPLLHFQDITLANTSNEGVVFLYPLRELSGVFHAYGRADGTITPYTFPENWVPNWKDTDNDGLPDCLDPQPRSADAAEIPSVLSAGMRTQEDIRFLYTVVSPIQLESTSVLAGFYCDGQLISVQPVVLESNSHTIQELKIPLADAPQADSMRIFQMHHQTAQPLWNAAGWQASH